MGEVFAKAVLVNPVTGLSKEIEFVVDTRATVSVVPRKIPKLLQIEPIDEDTFELANGKKKVFKLGEAVIRLNGKSRTFTVAFGPSRSQPLLGLVVLETLGLAVDPIGRKLVKRRLMMY